MNKRAKILLVEDSVAEQQLIEDIFADSSIGTFTLICANRLATALDQLTREPVDLIILDLNLPDSNGLDTLKEVSAKAPRVPVVVLTGEDSLVIGEQAIDIGAQDYLTKGQGTEIMLPRICFYTLQRHKAQVQAHRSRAFLKAAVDALAAAVCIVDAQGRIVLVNRAWRQVPANPYSLIGEAIEGDNYYELLKKRTGRRGDLESKLITGIMEIIAGDLPVFEMEYPCWQPEGRSCFFLVRVTRLQGGERVNAVVAHEDITTVKQAAIDLARTQEFQRQIFNTSSNLISVKDSQGRFMLINRSFEAFHGLAAEEATGKTCLQLPTISQTQEDKSSTLSGMERLVLEQQRAFSVVEEQRTDYQGRARWFRAVYSPITIDREAPQVLSIATEITDLRANQQALAQSEDLLRTILNAIQQWIVLFDTNRKVIWANDYAINHARHPANNLVGCSCSQLWHQGSPCRNCPGKQALESGEMKVEIHRLNPTTVYRITGCPVRNGDGKISGVVFMAEDISERISLEQQLRQAQKMESLGTLAGGIAHDFNNILTAILGFTELSLHRPGTSPELQSDLGEVLKASFRARDLVHQILTFSRRIDQELKPLDISLVIKEALKLLRATLPTTILIQSDIPVGLGLVMADPTQIHQIIMNLATNAAHAMSPDGGQLTVRLEQTRIGEQDVTIYPELSFGDYLRLSVSDTGSGIPPDIINSIFDPYFTTKEPGEGTGLGLSVVHGIVKEYGGEISVISKPGSGTRFTIVLPIKENNQQDTTEAVQAGMGQITGLGERIMVVDDEGPILTLCTKLLEKAGYQVAAYKDPRMALLDFTAKPEHYQLLLTDMVMPYLTGEKLALKILEIQPEFPVIIMSGNMAKIPESLNDEDRKVWLQAKPLDHRALIKRLHDIFRSAGEGANRAPE